MKRRTLLLPAALLTAAGVWRWSGLGTLRRARSAQPGLGLLFEGGPDPRVTPALLGALEGAGVRATFALDAASVRAYPDLVRRIAAAGHDVVGFVPPAAARWPWEVASRARGVVAELRGVLERGPLGVSVGARPGWAAWLGGQGSGLTVIRGQGQLSGASGWRGVRPGAVLHVPGVDSGVAAALPGWLGALRDREFEVHPLSGLRGLRRERARDLPATLLQEVDVWYDRVGRIRRVGDRASSLFRAGVAPYPLADQRLRDGAQVRRGEALVEFHLDSARLTELAERPVAGRRIVTASVRDLARALRDDPDLNGYPAVFSISIFSDVLGLYGFTVVDLPLAHQRRLTWWSRVIRRAYGVSDPSKQHVPKLAVMSREAFVQRHAQPGRDQT
ncbi:YkoP family protein [Deinococcus radiotolerans]|uniref:Polysaccharide deacetylase familiy protein n=1 Tax=Deinococcus radiotolerans TaxID=1309407 RepID=A0ABQ2FGK7_9DEIO|nr:polysaccharide deacetylase family protein [Deinococcus radiotolerans]GGK88669.1 polysaccharide deacetylase familiy protein [Deinococcus radiotolerans]